jgi:hypothetical protein
MVATISELKSSEYQVFFMRIPSLGLSRPTLRPDRNTIIQREVGVTIRNDFRR